jgi:hypothetical protein
MHRTGYADLPLHYGKCPKWLFPRMKVLSKEITKIIIYEYGQEEFLRRLSNPFFFQSMGCVIGYDWHSSGLTTTTCGALKEAITPELGIAVCGGKGKASRKAPEEIERMSEDFSLSTKKSESLVYSSRMSAKVDNTAVQDNYNLYHHCFIFNEKGKWVVIQQGMNSSNRYARRYHWINVEDFVEEPHSAICCDKRQKTLDMTAKSSKEARETSVDIVNDNKNIERFLNRNLNDFTGSKSLKLPAHHGIRLNKQTTIALNRAYEIQPEKYEELLAIRGIGPKAVRALALISELVYGKEPSWKDPAKFSFAHGGKDGIPYPVDRKLMDSSVEMLRNALENAKLGEKDRLHALKRLNEFI